LPIAEKKDYSRKPDLVIGGTPKLNWKWRVENFDEQEGGGKWESP
jgi:hypothetical protein